MKEDLTHYFLVNPLWLFGGLILYLIITLFKIHLIWYIQPKIYNHSQESIFKDYFKDFFQVLISKKKIIKPAFQYIFQNNKKAFLILDCDATKPIKKCLTILDGLTTFLKPYLLFAFIWVFIEFWISSKLLFNYTKITLGQIQLLLNFIEKIPLVGFLQKYKLLVLLGYGILCVLIPFLYDKEENTKNYKRYFTEGLVYLSLIANISFFGIKTGNTTLNKSGQLANLETKIIAIHDSIYKKLEFAIAYNDFKDSLRHEDNLYKEEAKRFESLTNSTRDLKIDSIIKEELAKELAKHLNEMKESSLIENSEPAKEDFHYDKTSQQSTSKKYRDFYEANYKSTNQYAEYASYMGNQTLWNVEDGETILKEVNNTVKENIQIITSFDKKLEKILGHFFDYGLESSLTEVLSIFGISAHKTLKKVASLLLSENYKKSLVQRTIKILNYLKIAPTKSNEILRGKDNIYHVDQGELVAFKNQNNDFLNNQHLIAENNQLKKNIEAKINSLKIVIPEKDEIIARLNRQAVQNFGISINNESEAAKYVSELGFKCDQNIDFGEAIRNQERKEYNKLFTEYENQNNLEDYNKFLQKGWTQLANQTSNETLRTAINITKFVGPCGGGASICILCGLPCAFPVCLARIP